jgi:hypothetical protein
MSDQADTLENLEAFRPDWQGRCEVCDQAPVVSATGLCGPCTWGEADTAGGAWWGDDEERRYQRLLADARILQEGAKR